MKQNIFLDLISVIVLIPIFNLETLAQTLEERSSRERFTVIEEKLTQFDERLKAQEFKSNAIVETIQQSERPHWYCAAWCIEYYSSKLEVNEFKKYIFAKGTEIEAVFTEMVNQCAISQSSYRTKIPSIGNGIFATPANSCVKY